MADLALLPNVLWTPDGGALENAIDGSRATLSGGSTLTGQAKFRNDYQRLTSTFPGLGYRASPAWTNLLYALNADNPSFEGGTGGGWANVGTATSAVSIADAWHGSRSLAVTCNVDNAQAVRLDVSAACAPTVQYTFSCMVKGVAGRVLRLGLYDSVAGYTYSANLTLDGTWQLLSMSKTIDVGSITEYIIVQCTNGLAGQVLYIDAISLVAGATVPQFEEKECTATEAYFANPIAAGSPVSGVVFLRLPWAGNDNAEHTILDCRDAGGIGWRLYKSAANNLLIETTAAAGTKSMGGAVNATNMAAGVMHRIAYALEEDNTQRLALNGTALTTSAGAAGREETVNANLYLGADKDGANHLNGLILPFFYRGVAWGDEECEYMSSGAVTPYSPDRSAMYCHHPNKAIYALKAPYQYIDARRDN